MERVLVDDHHPVAGLGDQVAVVDLDGVEIDLRGLRLVMDDWRGHPELRSRPAEGLTPILRPVAALRRRKPVRRESAADALARFSEACGVLWARIRAARRSGGARERESEPRA